MTTNAIDRAKLIVTSDSRWSVPLPNDVNPTHVMYVDDTGFEKISTSDIATLVFAGDGVLISQWKNWFKQDRPDWEAMPETERIVDGRLVDISICVVTPAGRVIHDSGTCLMHGETARFSGSGSFFARNCFVQNSCIIKAIDTAGSSDPYTGGITKYLELHSGLNNLTETESTLQDAERELGERGKIMELATGVVTSLKDALESQADALQALKTGGVHLSAPTGLQSRKWTASEKAALRAALEEVYADKRA